MSASESSSVPDNENPRSDSQLRNGSDVGDRPDSLVSFSDSEALIADPNSLDENSQTWKILLVDDEPEVHSITQLALEGFELDGKPLTFLSAYSGKEAQELMVEFPDTAIVFLDIVMETENAGLKVVQHIREVLNNQLVRIILRTGQPGQFREDVVALEYDINDYKTKTELTRQKLIAKVITSLRVFRSLVKIEKSKRELERIARENQQFCQQLKNYVKTLEAQVADQAQELALRNIQLEQERQKRQQMEEELRSIREQLSSLSSIEGLSDF